MDDRAEGIQRKSAGISLTKNSNCSTHNEKVVAVSENVLYFRLNLHSQTKIAVL